MWEHCHNSDLSALIFLRRRIQIQMSPTDLSSLKWGKDGELSNNDTLNLVERLMRAEEESKRSDLNCSSIPQLQPTEES
ncbi:MAG: hypothetical protein DBW82_09230 [Synechococcus sp. MED-G68]|nr:MAG: hypothetical protein DBW82_09230 [Synechococcus sp. MED-G68]